MTMPQTHAPSSRKPLRLWPGVAAAVLLLVLRFIVPALSPDAAVIGLFGSLACAAAIVIWWLSFSRAPWLDRLLPLADADRIADSGSAGADGTHRDGSSQGGRARTAGGHARSRVARLPRPRSRRCDSRRATRDRLDEIGAGRDVAAAGRTGVVVVRCER